MGARFSFDQTFEDFKPCPTLGDAIELAIDHAQNSYVSLFWVWVDDEPMPRQFIYDIARDKLTMC